MEIRRVPGFSGIPGLLELPDRLFPGKYQSVFKENIAKYPQFQTALDQLHDSAPQYAGALLSVFPEARQIVQQQIENMLNGQATPEEAAAEMPSQINSSIEEYNLVNE